MRDRSGIPFVAARDSGSTLVLMVVSILALGLVIQVVEAWGHGLVGLFNPQFLIQFVDPTAETPTTVPTPAQLLASRHFFNRSGCFLGPPMPWEGSRQDAGQGCDLVRIVLDLINTRFLMNKEGT